MSEGQAVADFVRSLAAAPDADSVPLGDVLLKIAEKVDEELKVRDLRMAELARVAITHAEMLKSRAPAAHPFDVWPKIFR